MKRYQASCESNVWLLYAILKHCQLTEERMQPLGLSNNVFLIISNNMNGIFVPLLFLLSHYCSIFFYVQFLLFYSILLCSSSGAYHCQQPVQLCTALTTIVTFFQRFNSLQNCLPKSHFKTKRNICKYSVLSDKASHNLITTVWYSARVLFCLFRQIPVAETSYNLFCSENSVTRSCKYLFIKARCSILMKKTACTNICC